MKRKLFAGIIGVSLLFSGCNALESHNLYALPQRSEEYRSLQNAVESAMGSGSFSAPMSGANRQTIQQADLNGDGVDEILVFCKCEGEHPLKVLIFRRLEGRFEQLSALEGDGTAFDSVQYAQIDGRPGQELLLTRRIGEQVQQFLTVYTMDGADVKEIMSTSCSAYSVQDLDGDERSDIFLLRANADGPRAFAELYRCQSGELRKDAESSLSTDADSVKRILTGNIAVNVPAVFVASAYDEQNLITDVFALKNNVFSNLTQNDESGQSGQTVRSYYVYSTDIDNDNVIELPNTIQLPNIPGDEQSMGQSRILWYNLGLDGVSKDKNSTYHNFAEGWFLFLPEEWCPNLVVTKSKDGGAPEGTVFCRLEADESPTRLLTIRALSGDAAKRFQPTEESFLLVQRGEISYTASLSPEAGLNAEQLRARFSFIAPDLFPETEKNEETQS